MTTKLFIGNQQADFSEEFNVMFSIGDINDISAGNANTSYPLNLPLTRKNKALLQFVTQADVKTEPTAMGRLYQGDLLIISGTIIVTSYGNLTASIVIASDDWMAAFSAIKMTSLDLSAYDHTLNAANVQASWSASYPGYRYPMIDFGGLMSGEWGANAKWITGDFVPSINLAMLMSKILSGYTISSSWLNSAYIKDLFITPKETANSDFITGKGLSVSTQALADNQQAQTGTIINIQGNFTMTCNNHALDEASGWHGNYYQVPATGTYRFKTSVTLKNSAFNNVVVTRTDEQVIVEFNRGGTEICRVTSAPFSGTELIDGVTYTLDSGYFYAVAGDQITVTVYAMCKATCSVSQTITLNIAAGSTIDAIWGNPNKYPAPGKPISLEDLLPDIYQMDFLAAIRDLFNLRFWLDKNKRILYIEPWDSFVGSTVVDLTQFVDCTDFPAQPIAQNYSSQITLKWNDDDSDMAVAEYLKTNTVTPGRKDIIMTSKFAKPGTDYREHSFSGTMMGYNATISGNVSMLRIWNVVPISPYMIFDRKVGYNTRLIHWDGLTAGFTWNFEGSSLTTYPKATPIDMAYLYTTYWQKFFHWIDKGKLYTIRMKVRPEFLTQFMTVVASAISEGFRATYCITINGIKNYFFCQKITSDGTIAELELPLKQ